MKYLQYVNVSEAYSLKGIILVNFDNYKDGLEFAKKGCKLNFSSGFCWHILGLVYKAKNNHDEALKSFKSSLRNDPNNITVMKDLCNSALQVFDLRTNFEWRRRVLLSRPASLLNWVYLYASLLLLKNELAKKTEDVLRSLFDNRCDIFFAEYSAASLRSFYPPQALYINTIRAYHVKDRIILDLFVHSSTLSDQFLYQL